MHTDGCRLGLESFSTPSGASRQGSRFARLSYVIERGSRYRRRGPWFRCGQAACRANISVNARGVGPVRLDGDEGEAVLADKPLGDGGACAIEFRGPVGGFSEEHNAGLSEPIKEQGKLIRSLGRGKPLAMMTDNLGDLATNSLATAFKRC